MHGTNIAIIGAGISGLTAADWLSAAGCDITIFEARERAGGRIHTLHSPSLPRPVEFGAEFVHGDRQATWQLAHHCPRFQPTEFPDRHWEFRDGELVENKHFWDDLAEVMEKLEDETRDESFSAFLQKTRTVSARQRSLAKDYVEGFHAAEPAHTSVMALEDSDKSAKETRGEKAFRLDSGYNTVVDCVLAKLRRRKVVFHFNSIVSRVRWEKQSVEISSQVAELPSSQAHFDAAIITLPLGVLRAAPGTPGAIAFEPELDEFKKHWARLDVGNVTKLTLVFKERFLPRKNFGFIHAHDHAFPTWWTDEAQRVFVAWAGGPKCDALKESSQEQIVQHALQELAGLGKVEVRSLSNSLQGSFVHDWRNDPFARGAYTVFPVGTREIPDHLARPIQETLFFAGETLAPKGQDGTVHGAISSGKSAAIKVLRSL